MTSMDLPTATAPTDITDAMTTHRNDVIMSATLCGTFLFEDKTLWLNAIYHRVLISNYSVPHDVIKVMMPLPCDGIAVMSLRHLPKGSLSPPVRRKYMATLII